MKNYTQFIAERKLEKLDNYLNELGYNQQEKLNILLQLVRHNYYGSIKYKLDNWKLQVRKTKSYKAGHNGILVYSTHDYYGMGYGKALKCKDINCESCSNYIWTPKKRSAQRLEEFKQKKCNHKYFINNMSIVRCNICNKRKDIVYSLSYKYSDFIKIMGLPKMEYNKFLKIYKDFESYKMKVKNEVNQ